MMNELASAIWPFVLLATLLVALFSASLVWAGQPAAHDDARPAPRQQGLALTLLLPLAAAALYLWLGEPRAVMPAFSAPADAAGRAHSVQALQARLAQRPDDAQGWLMLARSHQVLGQYAEAAEAFDRAGDADPALQDDAGHLLAWAETRLLAAERQFDARSHALVARALALAPEHPEVLLLAGLSALQRDDKAQATALLAQLREHYPAGSPDREALDDTLKQLAQAAPHGGAGKPGRR